MQLILSGIHNNRLDSDCNSATLYCNRLPQALGKEVDEATIPRGLEG